MADITLDDLKEQRLAIPNQPIGESIQVLKTVGFYFENTLPSDVEKPYILETEQFLNELYRKAIGDSSGLDTINLILEALAIAAELSGAIKMGNQDRVYFRSIKDLGRALKLMAGPA